MKEKYLWDKTGATDPEIERLEKALAVFRYQETDAPALPAKIIPFERKTPRNFLRLAFAFAACAAFVIISLGVWFQFSGGKIEVAKDSTETIAPQIVEKVADDISINKPDDSIVETADTPKQIVERDVVKNKEAARMMRKTSRNNGEKHTYSVRVSANSLRGNKPTVKLTKEEKYAYDQLILALSVTSSTFKKVKDKVDGVEEKTAVRNGGR